MREYLSEEYKDFRAEKGISYHPIVSHTPQQNGLAERMNYTITEMARALVIATDLQQSIF